MSVQIRRREDLCTNCMLCVRECLAGVWQEVDGTPQVVCPEVCNFCSHCVAVCPTGAVEHSALDTAQVRKVDKKKLDAEKYREIALSRRSVRQFKDQPVSRELIEDIIDCARYSPTASNFQTVQYIVVTDQARLKKVSQSIFNSGLRFYRFTQTPVGRGLLRLLKGTALMKAMDRYLGNMDFLIGQARAGRDLIFHHAPALIIICTPKHTSFGVDNCSIAAANITNYAHARGLGTCYIGFLMMALRHNRRLRAWLDIPKNLHPHTCLIIGHPAYTCGSTVSRKEPCIRWVS